jgi:hypothetical protein
MSAWLIATGLVAADEPLRALPSDRPRLDAAERAGPPLVVPPPPVAELPTVSDAPPPLATDPSRPARKVQVARPAIDRGSLIPAIPYVLDVPMPGSPPPVAARTPEVVAAAPAVAAPAPEAIPAPAAAPAPFLDTTCCETDWARVPSIQVIPRPGFFLVPPNGCGYYTLADQVHGFLRSGPPKYPYPPYALQPPSAFDADYRYLDDPNNTQVDPFDVLKRVHPTPDTMVTIGGQHSIRYMDEGNSRLGQVDNTYYLIRNRVWADVSYQDWLRVYGEFISAIITGNELKPLPIDENKADFLNLFVELKVAELAGNPAYVRVGRQELCLGSQRLVSALDWANTRRTFDGVRAFWRSDDFDVDAFWTRPVIIEPSEWDTSNKAVQFYGTWLSFRPGTGQFADLYYLGLTDGSIISDPLSTAKRKPFGDTEVHTFGARWAGNQGPVLYDFEGMLQCGHVAERDHAAVAYTAELGYAFEDVAWKPQAWVGYDYASGTKNPNSGDNTTFNQLFPFGHYYFGFLDLVGRQNIQDISAQLAVFPENWVTVVGQFHNFQLAESRDFLYNASGKGIRRSASGAAGRDVGNEIDFYANFHLTAHQDVLVGYSKLFAGDFIKTTGPAVSPDLFYLMYNFRW